MSKFSDYTEANIIRATLQGVTFPLPTGIYLALFIGDPTDAGTTSLEVTTAMMPLYARQDMARTGPIASGWSGPTNGVTSNTMAVSFQPNTGAGTVVVTHVGLYDAPASGNMLYHTQLDQPVILGAGDVASFGANALTIAVQ